MKQELSIMINSLIERYPELESCRQAVLKTFDIIRYCYMNNAKVLICGNGGSAADAEHIVGELMKGFMLKRRLDSNSVERLKASYPEDWRYLSDHLQGALPAISLVSHTALSSAYSNDVAAEMFFAQQVYGYGRQGDVLLGLSTSGNSKNVVNAIKVAKAFGIKCIGFTGENGGILGAICDVAIKVPSNETFRIQEYHLPVYHTLCAMLEETFFGLNG